MTAHEIGVLQQLLEIDQLGIQLRHIHVVTADLRIARQDIHPESLRAHGG